jgi:hypothetical protein
MDGFFKPVDFRVRETVGMTGRRNPGTTVITRNVRIISTRCKIKKKIATSPLKFGGSTSRE